MQRTTIMADEALLARLRQIAREEGVSLAEVIRQGMELRAAQERPRLTGKATFRSGLPPIDWNSDIPFQPRSWRS